MRVLSAAVALPVLFTVLLGSIFAEISRADDGVIEINAAAATKGFITQGDLPGLPVQITTPGSYRLTGPLSTTSGSQRLIDISASNVDLDLNGFTVSGPYGCSGTPLVCTGDGADAGYGVVGGSSVNNVRVHDGIVRGAGESGVYLTGSGVTLESVTATENRTAGIVVGVGARVRGCVAMRNGGIGISTGTAVVSGSVASFNGSHGIVTGSASVIEDNAVANNGGDGIRTAQSVTVRSNTVTANGASGVNAPHSNVLDNTLGFNTGYGLALDASSGYRGNVLFGNNGMSAEVLSGVQLGQNLCNGALCP